MLTTTACLITLIVMVNLILWFFYRRDLADENEVLRLQLDNACTVNRNLSIYLDELERRCETLRQARNTEMLCAKTRTQPVVRVYPVNAYVEIHINDN